MAVDAAYEPGPRRPGAQRWAIVSVEFPPQLGGVADYTHAVARGLAALGDEVHVWAPDAGGVAPRDPGVCVHPLPGRFGPRALATLERELGGLPAPYRLLVQYVPQGFGGRGMNMLFPLWLRRRRASEPWVMFHEVALSPGEMRGAHQRVRAHVTRLMAGMTYRAASRSFVSIPAWGTLLEAISGGARGADWLPIPSTVPTSADQEEVRRVRDCFAGGESGLLIGHFGVAGHHGGANVAEALARLLTARPDCSALVIGRRSEALGARISSAYPEIAARLHVAGTLPRDAIAAHLAACDLLVQPYPDGVSSRRTSLIAGLALGVATITVDGRFTEAIWRESGAVALAANDSADALVAAAEPVLANPVLRARLGCAGAELYARRFALSHTLDVLRAYPTADLPWCDPTRDAARMLP